MKKYQIQENSGNRSVMMKTKSGLQQQERGGAGGTEDAERAGGCGSAPRGGRPGLRPGRPQHAGELRGNGRRGTRTPAPDPDKTNTKVSGCTVADFPVQERSSPNGHSQARAAGLRAADLAPAGAGRARDRKATRRTPDAAPPRRRRCRADRARGLRPAVGKSEDHRWGQASRGPDSHRWA